MRWFGIFPAGEDQADVVHHCLPEPCPLHAGVAGEDDGVAFIHVMAKLGVVAAKVASMAYHGGSANRFYHIPPVGVAESAPTFGAGGKQFGKVLLVQNFPSPQGFLPFPQIAGGGDHSSRANPFIGADHLADWPFVVVVGVGMEEVVAGPVAGLTLESGVGHPGRPEQIFPQILLEGFPRCPLDNSGQQSVSRAGILGAASRGELKGHPQNFPHHAIAVHRGKGVRPQIRKPRGVAKKLVQRHCTDFGGGKGVESADGILQGQPPLHRQFQHRRSGELLAKRSKDKRGFGGDFFAGVAVRNPVAFVEHHLPILCHKDRAGHAVGFKPGQVVIQLFSGGSAHYSVAGMAGVSTGDMIHRRWCREGGRWSSGHGVRDKNCSCDQALHKAVPY